MPARHAALLALALAAASGCAPPAAGYEAAPNEVVICGHGPTVEGIDVSSWQGDIDWGAVARSGIRYAIVRIGDGTYHDRDFATNWEGARASGLIRGAYQFFEPEQDPAVQADIVVAAVGRLGPGDLPVTIDVEAPSPGVSPGEYTRRIHVWVDRVTAGTGRAPIVYTGRYYWDPYVASSDFVGLPLWHAQYTSAACPNIDDRWGDWAFWQYTSSGSVPGIAGNVDRDRFNGTYEELAALASAAPCDAHCEGSVIVDASCGRGDCAPFGSRCVDDALGARCAFFACPDVGDTTVCLDDHTIGTCHDGAISTGDCAAFGAYCSTAGASGPVAGHCASVFCVDSASATPIPHDACLPNGQLAHCTDTGGIENARDCAAGSRCTTLGGVGSCVDPSAPTPDAGPGNAMGTRADAGAAMGVGDAGMMRGADGSMAPMRAGEGIHGGGCSALGTGAGGTSLPAIALAILALGRRRTR